MMEKLKTLLLTLLVLCSLWLSYLLAYSSPNYDPIPQSDYVQTEPLGSQTELEDLLFPDQIVVHMGNQQHSVLYPNNYQYKSILENVKQRSFDGFRKTPIYVSNINWEDVRDKQQGVEIRFREGLPLSVLQLLLQIKGELPVDNDIITRIWIFAKDNQEEVRTFFFTDSPSVGYEVIKADFTVKDIENYIAYGDTVNTFRTVIGGDYYLPNKPFRVNGYRFAYTQFTAEQLKRSLFVDPGITRNLKERDGSEIYTDGKRGLQINNEVHWMNYSDPVAPVESNNDVRDNLVAGVQFVNQHGGWNGSYMVNRTPSQRTSFTNQMFVFRQYVDSYPIVNPTLEGFGAIKLSVEKGIVAGYERSIVLIDLKSMQRREVELPYGDALDERLKNYPRRGSILSVFPAYRPVISEKALDLAPVWALELRDGTFDFIE